MSGGHQDGTVRVGFKPEVVLALMNLVSLHQLEPQPVSVFRKVQLGAVLLLAVGFAVLLQVPDWVDARMNSLIHRPPLSSECRGFPA